jgi:hypothetical protein
VVKLSVEEEVGGGELFIFIGNSMFTGGAEGAAYVICKKRIRK